jgi:hypothetical protein
MGWRIKGRQLRAIHFPIHLLVRARRDDAPHMVPVIVPGLPHSGPGPLFELDPLQVYNVTAFLQQHHTYLDEPAMAKLAFGRATLPSGVMAVDSGWDHLWGVSPVADPEQLRQLGRELSRCGVQTQGIYRQLRPDQDGGVHWIFSAWPHMSDASSHQN